VQLSVNALQALRARAVVVTAGQGTNVFHISQKQSVTSAVLCKQVNRLLGESEVWAAFRGQKHDLFLPAGGPPNAGIAGLLQVHFNCSTFLFALFLFRFSQAARSLSLFDMYESTHVSQSALLLLPLFC